MTIKCSLTNDERRLGHRCRLLGCEACEEFNRILEDSPVFKSPPIGTGNTLKVLENIRSAKVAMEMLKDDFDTRAITLAISAIDDAIKWLDIHIGDIERNYERFYKRHEVD